MTNASKTTITILSFAALFLVIGWLAPLMFHSYAPQSHYVTAHDFYAENASAGEMQTICFDRTFHEESSGTVFVELHLVSDSGDVVQVRSTNSDVYFQKGRATISESVALPDDLRDGEYFYRRVYRARLDQGSVERSFVFESEPFYVKDNASESITC